jgi:hypothetical protein
MSKKASSEELVNAYRMLVQMYPEVDHVKTLAAVLSENGNGTRRRPGRPPEYERADLFGIFRLMLGKPKLSVSAAARKYVECHDLGRGTINNRVKAVLGLVERELETIEREPYDPRNLVLIELGWRKRKDGRKQGLNDLKEQIGRYSSRKAPIN